MLGKLCARKNQKGNYLQLGNTSEGKGRADAENVKEDRDETSSEAVLVGTN